MNVALRQPMTVEQFLAWEQRQQLKYEFDGVQARAMVGGTAAHSQIKVNLTTALLTRLRGTSCRPYNSDLKILVAAGHIRYSDAFVVCTPVPPTATLVSDPVVVFEVLSAGTMNEDLVVKNADYRATASILRYVILQQDHVGGISFIRRGYDWVADPHTGMDAIIDMPELGIAIPLSALYADLAITKDSE